MIQVKWTTTFINYFKYWSQAESPGLRDKNGYVNSDTTLGLFFFFMLETKLTSVPQNMLVLYL